MAPSDRDDPRDIRYMSEAELAAELSV